jgi:hypothetical protein
MIESKALLLGQYKSDLTDLITPFQDRSLLSLSPAKRAGKLKYRLGRHRVQFVGFVLDRQIKEKP